ncbi:unnamed protein product [[Actinomadura] parvosata subsp. kistnae]|nr:hypothetical protein [Nonomuraea sp. ATCC 55076]SPL93476.1 unnamed protein product [Actinomadura parvosata subsp. kistnae]
MGRHENPDTPKDKPFDPEEQGGMGSTGDEYKKGMGKHNDDEDKDGKR